MRRPGGEPTAAADRVAGVAVAALALGSLWLWATGELAARLRSGSWPATSPASGLGVALALPSAWPDLRRAWPPPVRAVLPPTPWLVAVAATTGVAGLALGAVGWRAVRRRAPARRAPEAARWATRRDLAPLAVRRAGQGRLVLGRSGRALVAVEARHSLLVVGPTQSGKTTGLAVPAILEWRGPVLATSVKDDLMAATVGWRGRHGPTWVFDPTAAVGAVSARWSPLSEAGTWAGAQRTASWLVDATPAREGMGDGAFWFATAAKLLAPLLLAAATGGATMAEVVRWNDLGDLDEPLDLLAAAGEPAALTALQASAGRDERLRSSVATTLETVLGPFADPAVAAATASTDVDLARLVSGEGTLYVCGPSHEQHRVQGLFAALVSTVLAAAVDHVHRQGRPLDPPLLVVLDEAANIAPLRDLDTVASTAAGLGVQLVTVCQDLAQLGTRYGADRARTIANNHRAKLVLSGVADLGTLDLVSGLAGEAAVREWGESADLRDGRRTRTTSTAYRRLAPTDALRRTPPGEGVLIYGHLPAVRLGLRPWYADRVLRSRVRPAGAPGPGSA